MSGISLDRISQRQLELRKYEVNIISAVVQTGGVLNSATQEKLTLLRGAMAENEGWGTEARAKFGRKRQTVAFE